MITKIQTARLVISSVGFMQMVFIGLLATLAATVVAVGVSLPAHAADDDIWTKTPGSYPYRTVVATKTETTYKNHRTSSTERCTGHGPSSNGVHESETYTYDGETGRLIKYSRSSSRGHADDQYCKEVITTGWTETINTKYYLMRLVPFTFSPKTTVDKRTSQPGDVVTFTHTIGKTGTPPGTAGPKLTTVGTRSGPLYDYKFGSWLEQWRFERGEGYQDNRTVPSVTKTATSYQTKITIQRDTPIGAKICYETKSIPASERGGEKTSGDGACTTVNRIDFNLVPTVSRDVNGPAEPGEIVNVNYSVQNTRGGAGDKSAPATWKTYGVKVNPGVSTAPISEGALKESTTPDAMITALGGRSKASLFDVDKFQNTQQFAANAKTVVRSNAFQLPIDAASGTKYCFMMYIAPPTLNASPTNRHSTASCISVGKKPKVNIYGGDLSVGRSFANDPVAPNILHSLIRTSVSVLGGTVNKSFGSWTEYDAYAPGEVSGFATASGLQGGHSSTTNDQAQWSKLTFVNIPGKYGNFSGSSSLGVIPDTAVALMNGMKTVKTFTTENSFTIRSSDRSLESGRYNKPTGDLTINVSTLPKGKSVVISVPKGTVTIAGDIKYASGAYSDLTQIPQLVIVAKNITINSNVTNVDSWLIAKAPADTPAGTDGSDALRNPIGVIKTCEVETALTTSLCDKRLTVNGPVMSNFLLLRRTAGLVGAAATTEDQPAEVFNLRADSYLWLYQQGKSDVRAVTTYTRELPVRF